MSQIFFKAINNKRECIMGMKALISGAMLTTLASGALAQSLDPVRIEMFRSILAGNECTLTEAAAANILPRFDFSREETRSIVGALVAAGEVQLDGNTLMLVDGSCAVADPVADLLGQRDVQQFIAVMAEYNCEMTEDEGERIFTERGISKAQVGAIVGPMIQAGMASFGNGILSVDSAYCAAPVVAEIAPVVVGAPVETPIEMDGLDRSGMFGMSRVRQLVDVMAANGCTFNTEVADGYLAEAGIDFSFASFVTRKMLTDGFADMVDGENMVLSAPYCISAGGAAPVVVAEATIEAPIMAAETDDSPRGRFMAAVIGNGCALEVSTAESYLADVAGLRMDQAFAIVDELVAEGAATLTSGSTIVQIDLALCAETGTALVVEQVAPVEPVEALVNRPVEAAIAPVENSDDPRAGLLAMLALNNCEVTQANAAELIAAAGLDYNTSMQMLTKMMGSGEATSPDGGQTLNVSAPLCVATAAEPMTPRETFINLIKQNNCSITAAEFSSLLPVNGLDSATAFGMISELEAEGVISLPATRDVVTLSAEMCR